MSMKNVLLGTLLMVLGCVAVEGQTVTATNLNDGYADHNDAVRVKGTGFTGGSIDILRVYYYKNKAAQSPSYIVITDHNLYFDTAMDTIGGTVNDIGSLPTGTDSIRIRLFDDIDGGYSDYIKADDVPPGVPTTFTVTAWGKAGAEDSVKILLRGSGDNGGSGTATSLQVKFAANAIETEGEWNSSATRDLPGTEPAPMDAGSFQTFYADMYAYGDSTFHYAIKIIDNMGNVSSVISYSVGVNTKPVVLSSFTAVMHTGAVTLAWRTESEADNAHWRIERSEQKDGHYVTVHQLSKDKGLFTTNFPTDYVFEDTDIKQGAIYYYRLYDIALDGNETVHGPITTDGITFYDNNVIEEPLIFSNINPHPVRYEADFTFFINTNAFSDASSGTVILDIKSIDGSRSYRVFEGTMVAGESSSIEWSRHNVQPGIYIARLSTASHSVFKRFMIIGR